MTLSLLRGSVRLNTLLPPRPDLLCSRVRVRPVSPGTPQVAGFIQTDRPFFDVHVELDLPHVKMSPPLADIQTAINRCSRAVLGCSKALTVWKSDATAVRGSSIYEVVTRDREVIRVVLLLAGSVEGAKRQVHEFLSTFMKYEYLWVDNMADAYAQFMAKNPTLEDFEAELKMYVNVKDDIVRRQHAAPPEEARSPRERLRTLAQISARSPSTESATPTHAFAPHAPRWDGQDRIPERNQISALSLETAPLKLRLSEICEQWKSQYAKNLHSQATAQLGEVTTWMQDMRRALAREINDLDDVRNAMKYLSEIREREAMLDWVFGAPLCPGPTMGPTAPGIAWHTRSR